MFYNLKNYNALPIKQELVKFDFKINIIPKEVEKYLSFSLNEKLVFIDSFQFEFFIREFSQNFDTEILDLVKQKEFFLGVEIMLGHWT